MNESLKKDTNTLINVLGGKATLKDQDDALCDPETAYYFALNVKGADIEKCQEAACKDPYWAYKFSYDIPGANIEKCQEAACKNLLYAYYFAYNIRKADLVKIKELCPKISNQIDEMIMNKVLK